MNIAVIYGSERKESTYHITRLFLEEFMPDACVTEFFLPKAMPKFCLGCGNCFMKGEEFCPHKGELAPIIKAMEAADLLIFTSPVYVLHVSGQMKVFLDHFGYRFMVHRPNPVMLRKKALVISTAAGGGMRSTNKDITDSLSFWGIRRIFNCRHAVYAISWDGVSDKKKIKIQKDVKKTAQRIKQSNTRAALNLKALIYFYIMRFVHKHFVKDGLDHKYWVSQGWLDKNRPWK